MTSKVNPRSSQSLNKQACYKCNQNVFQLEKITVGDHLLHESCFVCETCNNRLSSSNYVEYEGAYFCIKHSAHINQEEKTTDTGDSEKTCPFCKKHVLTAEGIILDNEEIVHRSCFTCSECNTPLSLGKFHIIEQKFYCTRHYYTAAADSGDINGRKKARDLYTGSLDADPLLSSLEDLKIQEQKQKEAQDTPRGSDANNSKQASPSKFPENSSYPSSEERKETDDNEVKDVPSASDDTARDFSVSHSENALDTEENTDGVSVSEKSDCAPGKPDTEANANTVEDSTETGTPAQLKRSRSRKKKELKAHGTSRKEVNSLLDEKESKKKTKKKRKTDRSEADDTEETNDAGKTKRRRDKLSRSKQKQNSSQKLDELEEDKDKKKKGKRGLFSITKKKQKSGSSVRKGSEDASHSPSLTSFVSSRFRKSKKDALADQNTRPVSPKLSPAQQQNKYSKPSEDSETEDSEEEALDSLQELAPLGPSDKKNRLSRLNRGDSKDSKSGRTGTSFDTPTKPAKIQPVSLSTPVAFTPLHSLSTCANTQDEDLPLATLNVPKTKDNEGLEWSSYELMRKLPKIELNLPEDVITEPSDVKERIMQSGFFVPSVLKFGLIGAQRRILDFLSILATTYPFGIQIAAGANVAPKAMQILQDRHGESFKQVSITELLSMDLDWIFVGSTYNDNTENILQALQSGKNVFCEKPVCFSVSDCLKLRDAHSKSGKKFYGGFVWRLVPFYQEIFDVLRSNILGNIVSMEINNLMSPSDTGPLMSTSSRLRKYCRTSLFDTFCFEIDIVNWLLESIPSKVGSFSGLDIFLPKNKPKTEEEMEPYLDWTYKPVEENLPSDPFTSEKDIDDNHVIMMEYRNNVRVTCHINTNSAFPQRRILICGLKGTLEGDLYTGTIRYKTIQEQYETNIIQVTPGMAHGGGDQQIMENLMDATKNLPTTQAFEGEEIFPSVITALGADQSKQEGSIIDLEVQWKQLGI